MLAFMHIVKITSSHDFHGGLHSVVSIIFVGHEPLNFITLAMSNHHNVLHLNNEIFFRLYYTKISLH